MRNFLTFNPKNVTIGSGVDQNKKSPSFWPIGQKMLNLHENLEFSMAKKNFPLKRAITSPQEAFFWDAVHNRLSCFPTQNLKWDMDVKWHEAETLFNLLV